MNEQRAKDLATGYAIVRDEKCLEPDCEVCVGDARAIADAIEAARNEERERWERKLRDACAVAGKIAQENLATYLRDCSSLRAMTTAERVLLAILEPGSET